VRDSSVGSSVESQPVKRRLGGWREMAASLRPRQLRGSSVREAVTRGPECGKLRNLHCVKYVARKRLVETVIDCSFESVCVSDL
jgi:hypothetical protein